MPIREYHKPTTIATARALLQRRHLRSAILAGGTWLAGEASDNVDAVVDISALGLNTLDCPFPRTVVRIGAAVTLQDLVERIEAVTGSQALSVIANSAESMAAQNIRNRATIGGSIVTADSSSPLVTALLACDAEIIVFTTEERNVTLGAFLAYRERVMAEGILITAVHVPVPSADTHSAYERVARTPRDFPIVCAVAKLAVKDGIAGNVRVAVGGVARTPVRFSLLEFGLERKAIAQHLDTSLQAAIKELEPISDWLGSAEYRKEVARVLTKRAVLRAAQMA